MHNASLKQFPLQKTLAALKAVQPVVLAILCDMITETEVVVVTGARRMVCHLKRFSTRLSVTSSAGLSKWPVPSTSSKPFLLNLQTFQLSYILFYELDQVFKLCDFL